MAPLERRGQGLLPRRCRMAAAAQQTEPVVEPGGDRRGAQRSEPGSCELEGEWEPVEAKTDPGDVLGVLLVELEARRGRDRSCDEERDGRVVEQLVWRKRPLGIRDCERGNAEDHFAGHPQRLAARGQDRQLWRCAEQRVRQRCRRRQQVLAVVEHEQQLARREEVDHGRDQLLRGQWPDIERGSDRVRDESWVGDGCELDERGTRRVRGLDRARKLEREPRLPDAAGARQRQNTRVPEQRIQLRELSLSADERARIRGQAERCRRAERSRLLRERGGQLRELFATPLGPVVVAVLREQLAAVEREHGAIRRGCLHPPRIRGRQLEQVDVDVDVSRKRQHLVADVDRVRAKRAPRDVHRLMQVVRGRSRRELAPEHVECLVAMQTMAACKSEQLHELARLLQAPRGVGHDDTVDRRLETPEQLDADSHRTNLTRGTRVAAICARR